MAPNRADLNSEAICKACHQVVLTKTDSNVASGSTAVVSKGTTCGTQLSVTDHGRVGAEEPFTVEMNQVRGSIRNPHFRFPCDLTKVTAHDGTIGKRGYVNKSC